MASALHSMRSVATFVIFLAAIVVLIDANHWTKRPSPFAKPEFARYMIRNALWGIVSAYSPIYKQPFGTLQSFADGPDGNSTGIPYFYIAEWSTTWKHIMHNNTVSLTTSEATGDYCDASSLDAMEPLCARIMLTGTMELVLDKEELNFAIKTLYARHPAMKKWPKGHMWHYMKLRLTSVNLLSFYGGISHVALEDYFAVEA